MITRVYIDNFRCFTNFEVRPGRVNLLIGANGSGKSTFFDLLAGVVGLVVQGVPIIEVFSDNTLTAWDKRTAQKIEIEVSGNGGTYCYQIEIMHDLDREKVTLQRELVKYDSRTLFRYEAGVVHLHNNEGKLGTKFPFRGTRSFLSQLEERSENTILTWLLSFFSNIWNLKLDPTAIDPESRAESESLDTDGANFSAWYRHLSQELPDDLPTLFERLGKTLIGFRTIRALSTGKGGQKRELFVTFGRDDGKSKYEVDFDDLSDGERAIIVLYCLLMDVEGEAKTLFLDEPENFVGLSVIQPWLVELADALRDQGQLFLISHHPEVIDYLAADHPLLFERPSGGPTRVRPEPFDREEGLKASEQVARGFLNGE